MPAGRTIVILGGGVGGVVAARALRRRLPREHRIVIVDRHADHTFAPSLLWLMVGRRRPEQISRPLARLARRGIEVRIGEIRNIDPAGRTVTVDAETIAADYLIVALGAELAPEAVPGLPDAGHNLYTPAGAAGFRDALRSLQDGRLAILTATPAYKCPAAPYEAALLAMDALRKRGLADRVSVDVWAAEAAPMATAGPAMSAAVIGLLGSHGIGYHPEHVIDSVDSAAKTLRFSVDRSAGYDLLGFVPPHRAPQVLQDSGLLSAGGWIAADRHTLQTGFDGVYAIGDVTSIPLAQGRPLPKAGVFAHGQAEVVAARIASEIRGETPTAHFDGRGECFIETGSGKAGFGGGDFFAEPMPAVRIHPPGRRWHIGKVLFEQHWLRRVL
jgi:sulfide:quinone oxidoreductase